MSGQTSAGADASSIVDVTTTVDMLPTKLSDWTPTRRHSRRHRSCEEYTHHVLVPGQLIDRYELLCPIGEGGMARVWAARHRGAHGFEKLFALKVIHSRFAEHPAFRTMLLDEAR